MKRKAILALTLSSVAVASFAYVVAQPQATNLTIDEIVGVRLPEPQIGNVGLKRARVFGRRRDIARAFGSNQMLFIVYCASLFSPRRTPEQREELGERILKTLERDGYSIQPTARAKELPPGQVLVLVDQPADVFRFVRQARGDGGGDLPNPKSKPINLNKPSKNKGCEGQGKVCVDTTGVVTVGIGCADEAEIEVSSDGKFQVSMPAGPARISIGS